MDRHVFDFDFGLANIGLGGMSFFSTIFLLLAFGALHYTSRRVGHLDRALAQVDLRVAALVCFVVGFFAVMLWPLTDQPFIYFQF